MWELRVTTGRVKRLHLSERELACQARLSAVAFFTATWNMAVPHPHLWYDLPQFQLPVVDHSPKITNEKCPAGTIPKLSIVHSSEQRDEISHGPGCDSPFCPASLCGRCTPPPAPCLPSLSSHLGYRISCRSIVVLVLQPPLFSFIMTLESTSSDAGDSEVSQRSRKALVMYVRRTTAA